MNKPRILVFDVETTPITAYVWGLKDQNIGLNQIVKDWQIMAWSAKWLGTSKTQIMYFDTRRMTEYTILRTMWKLLDEADVVITQNGKNFDSPRLNARFIQYGMKPPSPYKHLDTYKIAKSAAEFTSHKLEYLTEKLCVKYKKSGHKKFPGMKLWSECLKGNVEAWNEMKRYNILDVLSTEELYTKLHPWTPQAMPSIYHNCPKRFSVNWGTRPFGGATYQRLYCKKCKMYYRGDKI